MGKTKESSNSSQQQASTMTYTPTPEERELNKLALDREKFLDPQIRQTQSQGLDLVSKLLAGQGLPGYLSTLPAGISPEVTQNIVNQSLRDLNVQLAASGAGTFMDSGAAQTAGVRAASDIRNQSEQFNLQNLMQLLNLGVGGQAQVQQPIVGYSSLLSNRLAGLRTQSGTGSMTGNMSGTRGYDFFTSPFVLQGMASAGNAAAGLCYVAKEVFGSWESLKTRCARLFIVLKAPKWFREAYIKHGEQVARFISDKPWMKAMIRPVFEMFARKGGYSLGY